MEQPEPERRLTRLVFNLPLGVQRAELPNEHTPVPAVALTSLSNAFLAVWAVCMWSVEYVIRR